jgi:WXG100 family type VII secretion target
VAGEIRSHDESRTALIRAFSTAASEQQKAFNSVTGTADALASGWSGAAAVAYRTAMHDWLAGLQKVRNGLGQIEDAMVGLAKETTSAEDDNLIASTWFDPQSAPTATWT